MSSITVQQLFKFLCADVQRIIKLDVNVVDKGFSLPHFSANKLKDVEKYFIKHSRDAGNFKITNVEELLEYVVIFGHELTHCLNKHSGYTAENNRENVAIETHADFQGSRIATALYTYGVNLKKILKEDFKYPDKLKKDKTVYCKLMGKVFSKLYYDFYLEGDSKAYPDAFKRVGMNIAGVASFFYRSPHFLQARGEYVGMHLLMILALDKGIIDSNYDESKPPEKFDFIHDVVSVHRKIQGDNTRITDIESPMFEPIFGTNYHKNDTDRLIQKYEMRDEILDYAKKKDLLHLINEDIFKE